MTIGEQLKAEKQGTREPNGRFLPQMQTSTSVHNYELQQQAINKRRAEVEADTEKRAIGESLGIAPEDLFTFFA